MRVSVIIPVIASILILGTMSLSQEVFSAKSGLFWEPVPGIWSDGTRICPLNFTNIGVSTLTVVQVQFQLDENPTVKGLQALTYPLALKLVPGDFAVIEFPLEDVNGDPIQIKNAVLVSVTAEEIEDSPRGADDPKVRKSVSNKAIKP